MEIPEKICLFCKHFRFVSGEPDWSDITPGCEAEIYCAKVHWCVDMFEDGTSDYRSKLLMAGDCTDWKLLDELEEPAKPKKGRY